MLHNLSIVLKISSCVREFYCTWGYFSGSPCPGSPHLHTYAYMDVLYTRCVYGKSLYPFVFSHALTRSLSLSHFLSSCLYGAHSVTHLLPLFIPFCLSLPSSSVLTPSRCSQREGPYPPTLHQALTPFPLTSKLDWLPLWPSPLFDFFCCLPFFCFLIYFIFSVLFKSLFPITVSFSLPFSSTLLPLSHSCKLPRLWNNQHLLRHCHLMVIEDHERYLPLCWCWWG